MFVRIALIALVLVGLWGAGRLSYDQFQTGEACPILGDTVPACYIALGGYLLIALGVALAIVMSGSAAANYLFWAGTIVAGGLAAMATVLELIKGDVCPKLGSVPMCYLSLAFSIVIAVLFVIQNYQTTNAVTLNG